MTQGLALPEEYRIDADLGITQNLLSLSEYRSADTVFCFVGTAHEINTRPFLQKVLNDGKRLAVPLCVGRGIMEARRICSLEQLSPGAYGIYEPDLFSEIIPMCDVNFAVIPCLTANHRGHRLGHGGGYYDILFEKCPDIPAAVVCRERMIREDIPLEPFDYQFPMTVTEKGIYYAY